MRGANDLFQLYTATAGPAKLVQSRLVVSGTPSLAKSVEPFAISSVSYACTADLPFIGGKERHA